LPIRVKGSHDPSVRSQIHTFVLISTQFCTWTFCFSGLSTVGTSTTTTDLELSFCRSLTIHRRRRRITSYNIFSSYYTFSVLAASVNCKVIVLVAVALFLFTFVCYLTEKLETAAFDENLFSQTSLQSQVSSN